MRSAMRLTMPATFDIQYMHVGQENSHLNKIGTCVLTNMDVKYGGDKYKTYKDASSYGNINDLKL